jgi:hypothetical protein
MGRSNLLFTPRRTGALGQQLLGLEQLKVRAGCGPSEPHAGSPLGVV